MTTRLSRRQFVGASAGAAVAAAGLLPRFTLGADKGDKPGYILGIQSYTLRNYSIDDALKHTHEMGLGSVELFNAHFKLDSSPQDIEAMLKKVKGYGIKIMGHGVNPFTKDHEANKKIFQFAKAAGIRNISADPTEDSFDSLDKLVEEFDIRIAIHNHGPGARYDKVADVLNAVKGRHKHIGACADLGHYIRSAEDPVRAIHLLEGRLFGVHLKDFEEQKDKTKGVILGKGHLDVVETFKALNKVKFPSDGCLSLEYEENPDNPLDDVRQCLQIARDGYEKALA